MNICLVIPNYNHNESLKSILDELGSSYDVIVVDDGSYPRLEIDENNHKLIRLEKNSGKAEALKIGFSKALELGYTHAITLDADGQHTLESLPFFLEMIEANPESIILGVRDFSLPQVPKSRRRLNKFSNFWFWFETGIPIRDTQCGYRAYPLKEISNLNMSFGGFVFEIELLVKAAWAGISIIEMEIPTIYTEASLAKSHYRPIVDTAKFSIMNTKLSFMRLFFPKSVLKRMCRRG